LSNQIKPNKECGAPPELAPVIIVKPGQLRVILSSKMIEIDLTTEEVHQYTRELLVPKEE
jgi:hypothetical protein